MALLGELILTSGLIKASGSVAYVPQVAWIFTESIRKNIILDKQFDADRYMGILRVLALDEVSKRKTTLNLVFTPKTNHF